MEQNGVMMKNIRIGMNKKIVYYCPDCCVDNVTWCLDCGTAYEKKKMSACPKCGSERSED